MHAVARTNSGAEAKQPFDLLHERKADVEATLRKAPGQSPQPSARTRKARMKASALPANGSAQTPVRSAPAPHGRRGSRFIVQVTD